MTAGYVKEKLANVPNDVPVGFQLIVNNVVVATWPESLRPLLATGKPFVVVKLPGLLGSQGEKWEVHVENQHR